MLTRYCRIFNDGAFDLYTNADTRDNATIFLEHGKPLTFAGGKKGIRINEGSRPEIVDLGGDIKEDDLLFHDEKQVEPSLAFTLARMRYPEFPEPLGVFRCVEKPTYDELCDKQIKDAIAAKGPGDVMELLNRGDTWDVV